MKPLIPPHYYHDPEVLEQEKHRIFSSLWTFVGLKSQLSLPNDFITLNLGNEAVVVQNFDGELRALHNVCSHRFATLQNEDCGNRILQCPYHGWIYDQEGRPYAIPKRPKFPEMTQELQTQMSLKRYRLESCGELLFVQCNQDAQEGAALSLEHFLGGLFPVLEQMSQGMGGRIDRNSMEIAANWKICVENTLESYHVGFVHQNTFHRLGLRDQGFEFYGAHSSWTGEVDEKMARRFERVQDVFSSRPYQIPGYLHLLLFPATTLGTTYGSSFAIQEFRPISPNRTLFISNVYSCKLENLGARAETTVQLMDKSTIQFNRDVFEEDRVVTEFVHKGIHQTVQPGILSDDEERVCAFQTAYMQLIEGQGLPDEPLIPERRSGAIHSAETVHSPI